jgi:hypothetical protein
MIDKKFYITELQKLQNDDDIEHNHWVADQILCNILTELGYSDVAEEYEKISKWYA